MTSSVSFNSIRVAVIIWDIVCSVSCRGVGDPAGFSSGFFALLRRLMRRRWSSAGSQLMMEPRHTAALFQLTLINIRRFSKLNSVELNSAGIAIKLGPECLIWFRVASRTTDHSLIKLELNQNSSIRSPIRNPEALRCRNQPHPLIPLPKKKEENQCWMLEESGQMVALNQSETNAICGAIKRHPGRFINSK